MTQHDLTTSKGGRAYVAEFFSTRLRRHDFDRYIAERLAADFACALAEYLNEHLAKTEATIRFCPECGCLGDITAGYQACCPDSSQARAVPKHFAELCAETFQLCISQPYPSDVAAPSNTDRAMAPSRYTPEYANVIEQLCASLGWHRNKAALLDSDGIFRARTDDAVAIRFASASPAGCNGSDMTRRPAEIPLLAEEHKGMRVDYAGVLRQARTALARGGKEPALAEMLRQLQDHITELGTRWYAGDTAVVDELLQLYCVEKGARDALVDASSAATQA